MKKLFVLLLAALPIMAETYRIPVWMDTRRTYAYLTPGPNLTLTVNPNLSGVIDAVIPSPSGSGAAQVFFPSSGQMTLNLSGAAAKFILVFRNGLVQNDTANPSATPPIAADYTSSADKLTITLTQPANAGDLFVVVVWR